MKKCVFRTVSSGCGSPACGRYSSGFDFWAKQRYNVGMHATMNLRSRGYIEMKRLMFCIIALSIVFVFTACGGKRDGAEGGSPDKSAVLDASADISGEATDPESEPTETAGENSVTEGTDSEPLTADNVSSAPTEDTVPATDAPVTRPSVTTPSPVTSPITAPPTTNPPVTNPPVTEPPHVTEPCRHANIEVRNERAATISETGYTGDVYCLDCGYMLSCGWETPRIQQIDPANHEFYDIEMEIFRLTNEEREKNGVAPLIWDESLYAGAKVRVKEYHEFIDLGIGVGPHKRKNGDDFYTAVTETSDYSLSSFGAWGENCAGNSNSGDFVNSWMESPGHRANILDSEYSQMAVAVIFTGNTYHASCIFVG